MSRDISIHAPLAGSDPEGEEFEARVEEFQSTLPSRGATGLVYGNFCAGNISIHAPLAGSDGKLPAVADDRAISIHAPLAGSDDSLAARYGRDVKFQSTLPSRGATIPCIHTIMTKGNFNPRSPRGERQARWASPSGITLYFNPRSPRGERRHESRKLKMEELFQSTLPSRGATIYQI